MPPKYASTVFPFEAVGIVRFGAADADAEAEADADAEAELEEDIEQSYTNNVASVRDSGQSLRLSPPTT